MAKLQIDDETDKLMRELVEPMKALSWLAWQDAQFAIHARQSIFTDPAFEAACKAGIVFW